MKQKKIAIIMAGILTAAAAMTGCAEQNKTATQVDYTQNSQGKSEQTKQKTARAMRLAELGCFLYICIFSLESLK